MNPLLGVKDTGACSIIKYLSKGQKVLVKRGGAQDGGSSLGGRFSGFNGFLLWKEIKSKILLSRLIF